jgi:hypothetical protein
MNQTTGSRDGQRVEEDALVGSYGGPPTSACPLGEADVKDEGNPEESVGNRWRKHVCTHEKRHSRSIA